MKTVSYSVVFSLISSVAKKLYFFFDLKYIIEGKEHLPEEGPFIFVANHQTPLDIFGQCICCDLVKNVAFTCNRMFAWCGTFGIMGWLVGFIFIDRWFSSYTENQLNTAIDRMKKDKSKIWFFAEGRLSMDYAGEFKPFKKGAFHCAIKAKVPIVPVVFSPNTWFDRKEKRFDNGTVIIKILPPITTDNYTASEVNQLLEKVRDTMLEHYVELKNRQKY